ncbi:MAG: class I tRNA ligase family protein, partial [Planctomycetota bacterium]
NIRDWCISRQLWWGHRIPIWYCQSDKDCPPFASRETPKKCPKCGNTNLIQDPDVLDTWFSSWLWPFVVFGWPKETEDLKYFYPTTFLNSGKEIIFFWVSRMIMAGLEFTGSVPFRNVYIHGIAHDKQGRKLSKSFGNSPDPLKLIDQYGADALRFGIMANIPLGDDFYIPDEAYESGRNFCNKLWNASRLVLSAEERKNGKTAAFDEPPQGHCVPRPEGREERTTNHEQQTTFEDKWIISRLNTTISDYTKSLEKYEFSEAAHLIYHFFWSDLCDWYLEIIKPRLYNGDKTVAKIIPHIFSNLLRMLHPFIPFITEELWQKFREKYATPTQMTRSGEDFKNEAVIIADWPVVDISQIDEKTEKTMETLIDIIRGVRNIRNKMNIEKKQPLTLIISTESKEILAGIKEHQDLIKHQSNLSKIEIGIELAQPKHSATEIVSILKLFVPLEGIINMEVEKKRLQERLTKVQEQLEFVKQRLAKEEFKTKAPEVIIRKETLKLEELSKQYTNLQESLRNFSASGGSAYGTG